MHHPFIYGLRIGYSSWYEAPERAHHRSADAAGQHGRVGARNGLELARSPTIPHADRKTCRRPMPFSPQAGHPQTHGPPGASRRSNEPLGCQRFWRPHSSLRSQNPMGAWESIRYSRGCPLRGNRARPIAAPPGRRRRTALRSAKGWPRIDAGRGPPEIAPSAVRRPFPIARAWSVSRPHLRLSLWPARSQNNAGAARSLQLPKAESRRPPRRWFDGCKGCSTTCQK